MSQTSWSFRRQLISFVIGLGSLMIAPQFTAAAVPLSVTNQGRLFDAKGNPVNETLEVTFRIYDGDGVDANVLWTETHSVTFDSGYYAVALGEQKPLDTTIFDGSLRYFSIQIGDEPELLPRAATRSVPYALLAGDVNGDIHPTSWGSSAITMRPMAISRPLTATTCMGVDGFGLISYHDVNNGDLKVAHLSNKLGAPFVRYR